ncbi:MAG TPA: hypothetical protein DCE81_01525 [Cytophagales bacterium]|nr:hypothetical protein [Cytophagales bacterium]
MSESKSTRLGKAAASLNVSKDTLVEFLAGKGINIENNPNTKIEADVFDMLQAAFSSDQKAKEATAARSARTKELRETITIDSVKKKEDEEKEAEDNIDYTRFKRKTETKEVPQQEAKAPETAPAEIPAPEEKPAKKSARKKTETTEVPESEESSSKQKAREAIGGVKVVDKIDLEETTKPQGRKKKAEAEPPAVAEQPAPEVAPEPVQPPKRQEPELIRVRRVELAGTKVISKMELPATPEKKKPESDESEDDKQKRKRKRVSKVDISKQQEIDRRQKKTVPGATPPRTEMTETQIQNQVRENLSRLS